MEEEKHLKCNWNLEQASPWGVLLTEINGLNKCEIIC